MFILKILVKLNTNFQLFSTRSPTLSRNLFRLDFSILYSDVTEIRRLHTQSGGEVVYGLFVFVKFPAGRVFLQPIVSTPPMGRTACTEPKFLYKGEL